MGDFTHIQPTDHGILYFFKGKGTITASDCTLIGDAATGTTHGDAVEDGGDPDPQVNHHWWD